MTKCVKCGGDITEGAKFCSYCGTPLESGTAKDENKERTQIFVGTIRKCPNCGEQIGTNTTKCPSCGFIIEKRNVSASLDAFVKKFIAFTDDTAKREFIESYVVPNNKEDIRDLLNYAASQRDKDYTDDVSKAYWVDAWNNKCRQIVNQAFDSFGMDEDFASWLNTYKAGAEQSSAENEKLKKKLHSIEIGKKRAAVAKKIGIIVVILAVFGGTGFGIKNYRTKRNIIIENGIVPKENIVLSVFTERDWIEVITDATVKTIGISQRAETKAKQQVWCLDTLITFDILSKHDNFTYYLEKVRKAYPEYYAELQKNNLIDSSVRFAAPLGGISCSYQSKEVSAHNFDNIGFIAEELINIRTNEKKSLELRLTAIAGSRKECEDLAINLHKSKELKFTFNSYYDSLFDKDLNEKLTKK